ncbi:hypothetical protein FSP39_013354, partial [Pinctada imbricata]
IALFAVPCIIGYHYNRMYHQNIGWTYVIYPDVLAILTSIIVLIFVCTYLISLWRKMKEESILRKVLEYVKIGEKLTAQVKKSLILIQEAELVARGFTLLSHRNPVSRMEQSSVYQSRRQCPQLRQSVFFVSRVSMLQYKDATTNLLTKYPLPQDSDGTHSYLAYIPLEEYGECLRIDGNSPESLCELAKVTDGFSIAAIKQDHLSTVHNHHKTLVTLREDKDSKPKNRERPVRTGLQELHIAVHSLDLHLQAALLRVRSLTDTLEMEIEKQNNDKSESSEFNQSQQSLLQQISQELSACRGCWEEGISRLEKLQKKSQSDKPKSMKSGDEGSAVSSGGAYPIKIVEIKDPIIEDEVFEAYIDEEEEFDIDYAWDEYLTPEEKAKKKQEKAEAMRVLSELKSVIHVRAVEMDRREQIALEKTHCKDKTVDSFLGKSSPEAKIMEGRDQSSCSSHLTSVDSAIVQQSQSEEVEDEEDSDHVIVQKSDQHEGNLEDAIETEYKTEFTYLEDDDEVNEEIGINEDDSNRTLSESHSVSLGARSRLKGFPPSGLAFTASLAAQAVAVSHNMGLSQDTFGDSESSEGESQNYEYED